MSETTQLFPQQGVEHSFDAGFLIEVEDLNRAISEHVVGSLSAGYSEHAARLHGWGTLMRSGIQELANYILAGKLK
jgi:hypothetical protein